MTNIRLIFQSKWMVAGVVCEILAFIAAVGNWFAGSGAVWQLLPNVALTLATLGAVMVAGRVAWDYHGRGLNERQRAEVTAIVNEILLASRLNTVQRGEVTQITGSSGLNQHQRETVSEILSGSNLNEMQKDAVAQTIAETGLSPKQVSDLPAKLMDMYLPRMLSAQQAAITASNYLMAHDYLIQNGHGRVAVLTNTSGGLVEVQCIDPPQEALNCERHHDYEDGDTDNALKIAAAHLDIRAGDTVIWLPPASNGFRYTNRVVHSTIMDGKRWVFSFEDCVPKRLDPVSGDYLLTRDPSGHYAWERKA